MADPHDSLRAQLVKFLDWREAHADFDTAVDGIPPNKRGAVVPGLPHSPWQLLEHLRLAQHDILDFCVNPAYEEKSWPADYWPATPEPPTAGAWDDSIAGYKRDLAQIQQLAGDRALDLFAPIPHGSGQTYIREILLVVDHASYHVGQIVLVRRMLGIWPEA